MDWPIIELRSSLGKDWIVFANGGNGRGVDVGDEQLLVLAGPGKFMAVRADDAAQAAVGEVFFFAAEAGAGDVNLAFVGPRRHHRAGDETEGLHQGRGHRDEMRAGQRKRLHRLGELHIVADQDAEVQVVQLCGDQGVARRKQFFFLAAVKMRLAVVGKQPAVAIDEQGRVVNRIPVPLRVAVKKGDSRRAGNGGRLWEDGPATGSASLNTAAPIL